MEKNNKQKFMVLIADDDIIHRITIRAALENAGFCVEDAENGLQAIEKYQKLTPDLVILDVEMPELDGFSTCKQLRSFSNGQYLPILMVTGLDDINSINTAFDAGATDFLTKPINLALLGYKVSYLLRSAQTSQALAISEAKLLASELEILHRLGAASEFKDNETGDHIKRMSHYSELLAIAAGLDAKEALLIRKASPMHDVGKIGIPDSIILKPGKLTTDEFNIIKTHTTIGGELLSGNLSVLIQAANVIALTHHEKWDGSGYPKGLSGENIPLFGRICAITDVFDALTSERPYKKAWSNEDALNEIISLSGSHFDPFLVKKFKEIFPEVIKIQESFLKEF
jgi:cyclic di-GMP phosphodiesterase